MPSSATACKPPTVGVSGVSLLLYVSDVAPYETALGKSPAGVHRSLGTAARALEEVASIHGLRFLHATKVYEAGEDVLKEARVLALFTIGETEWSASQRQVIEARAAQGGLSVLGLHSATDSAYGWPGFGRLVGARFAGHPVTARLALSVVDKAHPATAHLSSPWMFEEELYLFRDLVAELHILLGVRFVDLAEDQRAAVVEHLSASGRQDTPELLPLAWCLQNERFRSFYTVLGHFLSAYEDTAYLQHLSGAIEWLVDTPGHQR